MTKAGSVAFDFSERDGTKTQYIKKFDQFATTWSFVGDMPGYVRETSVNQLGAVRDLNAESLRVDLFMGYTGIGYGIGSTPEKNGTSDGEYEQAMQVIRGMQDNAVLPQLVLFALSRPTRSPTGAGRRNPSRTSGRNSAATWRLT